MSFSNERTAFALAQPLVEKRRAPKKEKEVFTYDLGLLYIILPNSFIIFINTRTYANPPRNAPIMIPIQKLEQQLRRIINLI